MKMMGYKNTLMKTNANASARNLVYVLRIKNGVVKIANVSVYRDSVHRTINGMKINVTVSVR